MRPQSSTFSGSSPSESWGERGRRGEGGREREGGKEGGRGRREEGGREGRREKGKRVMYRRGDQE